MKWMMIFPLALAAAVFAADEKPKAAPKPPAETFTDPAKAGRDYADQGEYKNDWGGAQVIALGDDKFRMVTYKGGLPGAGWDIMASDAVPLSDPSLTAPRVNRVVLSNKGQRALVYYWYQGRGRIASNEYRVKWDLLRDAALYGRTEEALVRIVIYVGPSPSQGSGSKQDTALVRADLLALRVASPLAQSVFKVLPAFGAS